MKDDAQKKKTKKAFSSIANWILGLLIVFLVGCQVQIIRSKNENYSVPSLFGFSFMTVLTDSMVNTSDPSQSLDVGTGVIMQKVPAKEIVVGDVITFYSEELSSYFKEDLVVSHRVMSIETASDGSFVFYTRGDNLQAQTCKGYSSGSCSEDTRDIVPEKFYIGKIVYHNNTLGGFLSTAQQPWFIPVCCLAPLLIIAISSLRDLIKAEKAEQYSVDREILLGLNAAGIDFNDERAVYLFSEKQRYKIEMRESLEKEKENEKKRLLKEMKKKGKTDKMEGNV
jgi:signal peptidase I